MIGIIVKDWMVLDGGYKAIKASRAHTQEGAENVWELMLIYIKQIAEVGGGLGYIPAIILISSAVELSQTLQECISHSIIHFH
jgi:hypothetical protein